MGGGAAQLVAQVHRAVADGDEPGGHEGIERCVEDLGGQPVVSGAEHGEGATRRFVAGRHR